MLPRPQIADCSSSGAIVYLKPFSMLMQRSEVFAEPDTRLGRVTLMHTNVSGTRFHNTKSKPIRSFKCKAVSLIIHVIMATLCSILGDRIQYT